MVKILDYGLMMSYIDKQSGKHKSRAKLGFKGTLIFGSIKSLEGYT